MMNIYEGEDTNELAMQLAVEVSEGTDDFVFKIIKPYCEGCVGMRIEKKELERALNLYYKKGLLANEYQKLASRTINGAIDYSEMEMHALHGMVGEIGEIHSIYQKKFQGHHESVEHLKKEVGDLLWFIAEYCSAWGWKLEDVMQMNVDKLKARYPEGFDANHSLNRKEGDI